MFNGHSIENPNNLHEFLTNSSSISSQSSGFKYDLYGELASPLLMYNIDPIRR